jgi:hypothetical protein
VPKRTYYFFPKESLFVFRKKLLNSLGKTVNRGINMSHSRKFWSFLACAAALISFFLILIGFGGVLEKVWYLVKPELIQENSDLAIENKHLKHEIASLEKQNMHLRKYLDEFEKNFSDLKAVAANCNQIGSMLPADLPAGLTKERFEIRQLYRDLLAEKKRWDKYQKEQYADILESTIEPRVEDCQNLNLENEGNLDYFVELESGLALHRRLIRDVRLFHDEIKYQKKQRYAAQQYELYDLKFQLATGNERIERRHLSEGGGGSPGPGGCGVHQTDSATQ